MLATTLFYGVLVLPGILLCRWIWDLFAMRRKLSSVPGPKSLPFIGNTWQLLKMPIEDRLDWVINISAKFRNENGLVLLWIGPEPVVIVSKPELVERVLSSNTLITKSTEYNVLKPWLGEGLITSTGDHWFKHRKMINPAFRFNVLEDYAAAMQDNVEILAKCLDLQLQKEPSTPINIFEYVTRYALDTICQTAMGVNMDCQIKSNVEYAKAAHKYFELSVHRIFSFWLKWDAVYYRTSKGKECSQALKTMHDFTEKVILRKQMERKNKPSTEIDETEIDEFGRRKRKAFLDLLLDESEKAANPLTFKELRDEVNTFMVAGHDTTATAISWALFALGNEPEIQDKVYEEIRDVFGSDTETATTKQLGQLKYLDRVIKEASRFYSTVPFISRYVDKDTILDGYLIPKGTILSIGIHMLHHNPEVWEDPEKFDPDRFLPENIHSMSQFTHIPFSAGPRNCVGQKFAYLELKTALTAILRRWRVSSVLKHSQMKLISNFTLKPHNEKIELYFKPRN